jgi:hypothetical protein
MARARRKARNETAHEAMDLVLAGPAFDWSETDMALLDDRAGEAFRAENARWIAAGRPDVSEWSHEGLPKRK